MPSITPIGVADAKTVISYRTSLKSFGNDFTSAIPREVAAALLWMQIAKMILSRFPRFI